ncbi:restriction endonuclease subunit S [Heyndrickxia faecalis]|uniref:restriction endonuclease subunit S n=1 Tax=Heyndrickxia faecalis TaxID=2824910 RepID=UPI003D219797
MRKKQKTMEELLEEALVPEEEQSYEVRKNYKWVKLGSVISLISGRDVSSKLCNNDGKGIPYIMGASNIIDGKLNVERWIETPTVVGLKGDVLISVKGTVGKTVIQEIEKVHLSRQIMALRCTGIVCYRYLYYYINTYVKQLKENSKGIIPGISREDILNAPFPLASLKEQKRIVDKVERLLSKIDEAKRLIEEAKETFELRRAAMLDKAFRGEMMEKSHISRESNANLYEIPINWKWKTFGDVAQVCSNLVDPKQYLELPHIAPDNIEKGTGQLLEYQTIEESKVKSPKHYFKKGQILYSKIRPYLSKVIIAEFEGLCSADMYPIETDLDAKYLFWYMLSPFFVEKASTAGSRSVLPKINKKELGNIPIPVPPKETQKKIVRIIESALSREKQTIGYLESIVGLMEKLKQSILSKAFRGELGTNDPDEESAIELLKEVLQEQTN